MAAHKDRYRRRAFLLLACFGLAAAPGPAQEGAPSADYRGLMRELVQGLAARGRNSAPDFIVVAQNGLELLTVDGDPASAASAPYLEVLDGVGQEELFYGYPRFNRPTNPGDSRYLQQFLKIARTEGLTVLIIDYCRGRDKVDDVLRRSAALGFLSFASFRRELDAIPRYPRPLPGENSRDIAGLAGARNFLYLINPGRFAGSREFFAALQAAPHDLLIIDALVEDAEGRPRWIEGEEIESLKTKPQGGRRLVLSYLSVGEAESYRPYWRKEWDRNNDGRPDPAAPVWLERENPSWPGNYKVRYWDPAWQQLIFTGSNSYLSAILEHGFDGVYLDLIDAYLYFEEMQPTDRR
jgi:cysteinyl-tRNA synthetase